MERLQKVLAGAGVASRRKCEEYIVEGRVKVNGKVIDKLGTKVDPEKDLIEFDNKKINNKIEKKIYVLLNKPLNYITTMNDPEGRKNVADLVNKISQRIYPVGRLDYDTEGLLIMTNDGDLTYKLTHPSHEIKKTYLAVVEGFPGGQALNKLKSGILLEDGLTAPADAKLLKKYKKSSLLQITIHEGRNRQVRRMCDAVGHPVVKLKRIQIAFLRLDNLKTGKYRHLTVAEIDKLKKILNIK